MNSINLSSSDVSLLSPIIGTALGLISKDPNKLSSNYSLFERIWNSYARAIMKLGEFLKKHEWYLTCAILDVLLMEPWLGIKAAFMMPFGWKKSFNFYDMNPKKLTEDQATKQPILLIHGALHNQSGWISLAKSLKAANSGPVYTVNLCNMKCSDQTNTDYRIVERKIKEIKAQYSQFNNTSIKVNLVGHSWGAYIASIFTWTALHEDEKRYFGYYDDIGKVISLGNPLDQDLINNIQEVNSGFHDRIYEITGKYDSNVTEKSLLPANRQEAVNTGHLGLLYSDKVHQRVVQLLT